MFDAKNVRSITDLIVIAEYRLPLAGSEKWKGNLCESEHLLPCEGVSG